MALANEPDLLLADEVTGELDSATAEQVMEVIFEAWRERGLSVLFVTHSEELAARAQRRLAPRGRRRPVRCDEAAPAIRIEALVEALRDGAGVVRARRRRRHARDRARHAASPSRARAAAASRRCWA